MSSILVAGGAGYIGSHTVAALIEKGEKVVVLDNLVKGHEQAVWDGAEFIKGNIKDGELLRKIFTENDIDSVIDFAAYSLVGESVRKPYEYFDNNVCGTLALLKTMVDCGVKNVVFSSTAATYGEPENTPILESDRTFPTSPYGESKLAVEKILKWFEGAYGLKYAVLRYFNAAGAHISGKIGEAHSPESHLIPIVLQAALGEREFISVFGGDYPTPDGTCVRDYIHVSDLSDAHILAVEFLRERNESSIYNLGNGKGFSVKEVIDCARKVTGKDIKVKMSERREGDPAVLVASSEKITNELGFSPKYADLEKIIQTAWTWHSTHPNGYEE
jgi:UDP-glucose 4-epimerase